MCHITHNKSLTLRTLFSCVIAVCLLTGAAYAVDDYWIVTDPSGTVYDLSEMQTQFYGVWKLLCSIAYPCAAICFAWGAFKMLSGDERTMAQGKRQMISCLVAIAALLILPLVVKMGTDIGIAHGWTPPVPSATPAPPVEAESEASNYLSEAVIFRC